MTKYEIKEATLKYCVTNLKGGELDKNLREMVKQRKENQLEKMNN